MEFKKYQDLKEFVEENEKLILEKEWLNNLMVGNYKDAVENEIDENWLLARVTDNGKTELIILLRRIWKLLLYSPTGTKFKELYKFAAEETYKVDKNIPSVNTEKGIGKMFAEEYCKLANKKCQLRFEMRILLLENLIEPYLKNDLTYRKAELKDKEILKGFTREFYKEELHEDINEETLEENFHKNLEKGYYVLEKDGCVLFTDDTNPISNHVYEKIGYVRKVDTRELDFVELNN